MKKLIMLDFDGVVADGSNQGYFLCYHKAIESVGVNMSEQEEHERIVQGWGSGHEKQLQILLDGYSDQLEEASNIWLECVNSDAFWQNVKVISGAKEAIERMTRVADVVIVSGSEKRFIQRVLEREGIEGIQAIYSSYDVASEFKKPHPHTIELALKDFGVSSSEAMYVGDMENDVVMARAAGVEPVLVLTGDIDQNRAEVTGVTIIKQNLLELAQELIIP